MKPRITTRAAGFSLIELLVAMAIGLVVTLAITSVLIRSEGSKRSSTSVNEINQTGAYTAFVLDRVIRSAGSGYSQRWNDVYGCLLDVSKSGSAVLPIPATISASSAFRNITASPTPLALRLAPVIIGEGLADTTGAGAQVRGDVLLVMAGTAGVGESPQSVSVNSINLGTTPPQLQLQNTLGYSTDDLILLSDKGVASGCMIQQVGTHDPTTYGQALPLKGSVTDSYYQAVGTHVNLEDLDGDGIALQLGNAVTNRPQFMAYAVGDNQTLFSYDLLNPLPTGGADNRPDTPIAEGVVEMRALYGLDTTNPPDGVLDEWHGPTGDFTAAELTAGTPTARNRLRQIIAIRVGMILRTSLQERSTATSASAVTAQETYLQPSPASVTLFEGLEDAGGTSLSYVRSVTGGDQLYRYRPVDVTIPLRNVQLAPQS
ncbi:MAG: PilW family protein [Deltaproteobacteria bacterium]|nr:PilW family protein [Nannocystaceae bacterium]